MPKPAERYYEECLAKITGQYGNDLTYSDFLQDVGKKMFGQRFVGIYPADKIPKLSKGEYIIANLDRSYEPGSHWVGIVKGASCSYIYDSFGRKGMKIMPTYTQSGNGTLVDTEDDPEQSKKEENCGQRVLAWLCVFDKYGWRGAKQI